MRSTQGLFAAAIAAGAFLFASPATATTLEVGDTVTPQTLGSFNTGSGVAAEVHTAFSGIDGLGVTRYTGFLDHWVYLDATNMDLTGALFVWQVQNDSDSMDGITRITMTDFAGWDIEVAIVQGDPGNVPAFRADRGATGVIGFNFDDPATTGPGSQETLSPGETTYFLLIQTNAPLFKPGSTQMLNGAIKAVSTYAPAPVPEPGSLLLLGSGLAAAGFLGRRRRRR